MKIWVTGIAGFLGSHVADACLARGDIVAGNDSLICGDRANVPVKAQFHKYACQDGPRIGHFVDDLRVFKPDTIVHCAATAHEGLSTFSPHFITRNIFEASVATFSASIAAGMKRIVFMSSMSRYGKVEKRGDEFGLPFKEFFDPRPVDPYGVAKVAAEDCLKILCESHGVKWTIAVPHNIIGVRQNYQDPFRNVASIMINRCLRGDAPIVYGDGLQTRCFSPVKDVIPSLLRMIDGKADGHVVNIGPDKGEITILALATKIRNLTGVSEKAIHMDDRPNEVKHAYCSSDKARKMLHYKEKQTLDECLKEMVADIKRRGAKPFKWGFPLEIVTDKIPKTWLLRLM